MYKENINYIIQHTIHMHIYNRNHIRNLNPPTLLLCNGDK
jgi:hypothetical protein